MWRNRQRELSIAAAIVAIAAVLAAFAPAFFTFANMRDLLLANVPTLIVAVGMTLIVLAAEIDISVGSQFAICSVAAGVFAIAGLPMFAALIAATLTGALLGALNGALVAWVRIPSIVVTLAAMVALRDGLRWVTQGAWVQNLPPGFHWFGLPQAASEWLMIGAAGAITAVTAWALRHLAAGRAVYAIGSDSGAARLAGINPQTVVFSVFTLTGALTGFAAALNAARFEQIPSNAGIGLELKVIAAVVVGGVSITGGRGTMLGALLGVILLGLIGPALTFLGFSAYWERAIEGGIILAAVSMDALSARWRRNADLAAAHGA
jgi:rhamnose transport system permease protein